MLREKLKTKEEQYDNMNFEEIFYNFTQKVVKQSIKPVRPNEHYIQINSKISKENNDNNIKIKYPKQKYDKIIDIRFKKKLYSLNKFKEDKQKSFIFSLPELKNNIENQSKNIVSLDKRNIIITNNIKSLSNELDSKFRKLENINSLQENTKQQSICNLLDINYLKEKINKFHKIHSRKDKSISQIKREKSFLVKENKFRKNTFITDNRDYSVFDGIY